jgi:hypothetical protein
MANWPGSVEGQPADSSALTSSVVRDRLDGLFYQDFKTLRMRAESPPSMRVWVDPATGHAARSDFPHPLYFPGGFSAYMYAPSTYPRVDEIYLSPHLAGTVGVSTAAETVSINYGICPPGNIPLGFVYLRPGMSSIKDVDDGVNGYVLGRVQPWLHPRPNVYCIDSYEMSASNSSAGGAVLLVTRGLNPNTLYVGKRLKVKARGYFSSRQGVSMGWFLYLGGSQQFYTPFAIPSEVTNQIWEMEVDIVGYLASPPGQRSYGKLSWRPDSVLTVSSVIDRRASSENTAGSLNLQVYHQMDTTSGGFNNCVMEDLEVLLAG